MHVFETPKYITGRKSVPGEISLEYILPKSELEIELNEISDRLHLPTAIIEFKKANKRTDSTRSRIFFTYCCDVFRTICGWRLCTTCDEKHAALFRDIDLMDKQSKNIIQDKINRKYHIDPSYENEKAPLPKFESLSNEPNKEYLEYDCPMMGLRELIFPIKVEQRILGVMFAGQIFINSKEDCARINSIREQFLKTHEDIFKEYQKIYPDISINEIEDKLMCFKDPREFRNKFKPIPGKKPSKKYINIFREVTISPDDYEGLIKNVLSERDKLEAKLAKKLREKRKAYVKSVFNNLFSLNYREMQHGLQAEGSNAEEYWKMIKENLEKILPELNLRSISIYTSNPAKENKTKTLNLTVNIPDNNEKINNSRSFNFQEVNISDENIQIYTTLELDTVNAKTEIKTDKNLYNCVKVNEEKSDVPMDGSWDVFFYPVRTDLACSVAIIIGYQKPDKSEVFSAVKQLVGNEIPQLTTLISLISAFLQNVNSKRILHIYRHEISHLTLGLRNNNNWYFSKPERKIMEIKETDKIDDIYEDNMGSIEQLNYFTSNTGMMLGLFTKENLKKEEIRIFKDLLFKWEIIYKDETHVKNIEFILPDCINDEQQPLILSDKQRLEQLIYNLINNAIKYSYWGTRIYIDCKSTPDEPFKQCLSIADYGYGIDEGDIPYRLYQRSSQPINNKTEGCGIGLYVAREVAKLLDISLSHKVEEISKFNVPLMRLYLDRANRSDVLYDKIKEAYENLDRNNVLLPILSQREAFRKLTDEQIFSEITFHTYKVTFEVKI